MNLRVNCTVTTVLPDVIVLWFFGNTVFGSEPYNTGSTHQLELSIDNVNLTNGGVYTCRAFHDYGEVTGSTDVVVFVPPPSDIAIMPTTQSVNHSDTATFTCTVTSLTHPTITWSTNATTGVTTQLEVLAFSQGSNTYTSTLVLNGVTLDSFGGYTCNFTNEGGSNTATATLNVEVPVSGVIIVPVLTNVLYNRTLQLNCTVSSRTYPNITWSTTANIMINDTAIVTTKESDYMFSSVLSLNGVDLRYSGLYTCSSTNEGGSASDTSTVTVNFPYLALFLDSSPEVSLTLGEEHTLQCSISLPGTLSATTASFMWYKDSSVITSGLTTNLAEGTSSLNLMSVLSAESGNYTCVANVLFPYVNTGINLIVTNTTFLTVTMPEPTSVVLALDVLSPPYYAGLRRDLQCSVGSLYTYNDPTVTVSITFLFNGLAITASNNRRVLRSQESDVNNGVFHRSLLFLPFVASEDSGLYTCLVNVSSGYLSDFIVNVSMSRTNEYVIVAPKPTVQLISTQYHLPTHSSFNTATITCIASLQLGQSDRLDYPKVFTWSSNGTPINDASSPTNTYNTSSESMIQRTYTIAGVYSYTCNVSVSVPGDPLAFSYDTIMITATGSSSPHLPVNTTATSIRHDGAVINWIVTSIAYTPEQYTVLYGTSSNDLSQSSLVLNGSANFSVTDAVLVLDLVDLMRDTVYYYRVRSTNTEGSTESDINNFRTREKLLTAPTAPPTNFVIASTSSSRTLLFSWDPPSPNDRNGPITSYNLTCYEIVAGDVLLVTTPTFPYVVNKSGSVQLSLSGFRPGTLINCSLTSSNEVGTGPPAFTDIITREEETPTGNTNNFGSTGVLLVLVIVSVIVLIIVLVLIIVCITCIIIYKRKSVKLDISKPADGVKVAPNMGYGLVNIAKASGAQNEDETYERIDDCIYEQMDDKPVQEQQENTPVVGGSVGDIAITSCPAYEATTSFTATKFIAHQELDEKP